MAKALASSKACWRIADHRKGMAPLVRFRRGCLTVLSCGQNLLS